MTDTPTGGDDQRGNQVGHDFQVTDPAVMRALAHPLRIDLLELLDEMGEATASELAARLDQSVANCSFHLRILASGGYIERAEPRGREKPWRPIGGSRMHSPDPENPDSIAEVVNLASLYVQREAARVVSFLNKAPVILPDPKWLNTVRVNNSTFWATPEEMAELTRELDALQSRFSGRSDPANRPEGAVKGYLFATVNPDLDDARAHAQATQDDDGSGADDSGSSGGAPHPAT